MAIRRSGGKTPTKINNTLFQRRDDTGEIIRDPVNNEFEFVEDTPAPAHPGFDLKFTAGVNYDLDTIIKSRSRDGGVNDSEYALNMRIIEKQAELQPLLDEYGNRLKLMVEFLLSDAKTATDIQAVLERFCLRHNVTPKQIRENFPLKDKLNLIVDLYLNNFFDCKNIFKFTVDIADNIPDSIISCEILERPFYKRCLADLQEYILTEPDAAVGKDTFQVGEMAVVDIEGKVIVDDTIYKKYLL